MRYETVNGWTKKKMIAHIKKNFKGQSKMSMFEGHSATCLYRGPKGKKCAVGLFIPDEVYSPGMEDKNVAAIVKRYPKLLSVLPLSSVALGNLQYIHDYHLQNKATLLKKMINWINENVK